MKKLYHFTLIIFTLAMSSVAWANCSTNTGSPAILTLPELNLANINPKAAMGSILYQTTIPLISSQVTTITCLDVVGTLPAVWNVTTGLPQSNLSNSNAFGTSIPGVAIAIGMSGGFGWLPYRANYPQTFTFTNNANLTLALYKSGDITQRGQLSGEIANAVFPSQGDFKFVSIVLKGNFIITPTVPTCDISTPSISVNLNKIPIGQFSGPGSVSPSQSFNIGLQCSGAADGGYSDVYVTLTDKTNTANVSGILSLTNNSTASGVGIQVLNGSTVINFGPASSAPGNLNQWYAGSTGNGVFNIPLTARYVQTGANVTAGIANGVATFTMSYQ